MIVYLKKEILCCSSSHSFRFRPQLF